MPINGPVKKVIDKYSAVEVSDGNGGKLRAYTVETHNNLKIFWACLTAFVVVGIPLLVFFANAQGQVKGAIRAKVEQQQALEKIPGIDSTLYSVKKTMDNHELRLSASEKNAENQSSQLNGIINFLLTSNKDYLLSVRQ